jgi:alpha-tubulin suppressor-like RCC1 family protein
VSCERSLSAGFRSTCALPVGGQVMCWGDGWHLGNGDVNGEATDSPVPIAVANLADAVAVSTGLQRERACAIRETGEIVCWHASAETVPLIADARAVSVGYGHTCALRASGTVGCWGKGSFGQLGTGTDTDYAVEPVQVVGLMGAVAVATGADFTCALRGDGHVVCWGNGSVGQLGFGATVPQSSTPVEVADLTDAIAISAAWSYVCALRKSGLVACWGLGTNGGLGVEPTDALAPRNVPGITDAVAVTTGDAHTCALRDNGSVLCWGANFHGQLGTNPDTAGPTPIEVPELPDAIALTAGDSHTCALRQNGTITCWGLGDDGQLGNGMVAINPVPVVVRNVHDAVRVDAGLYHTCALRESGELVCWGWNQNGALGDGTTESVNEPVAVLQSDRCSAGCRRRQLSVRAKTGRYRGLLGYRPIRQLGEWFARDGTDASLGVGSVRHCRCLRGIWPLLCGASHGRSRLLGQWCFRRVGKRLDGTGAHSRSRDGTPRCRGRQRRS